MANTRALMPAEIMLARTVFGSTIPYDRVHISDLAIGETAVTLAGFNLSSRSFHYRLCWPVAYSGIVQSKALSATFIHEMTHVWQGANGAYPTFYMAQSITDQLRYGINDVIEAREWKGWGVHRGATYRISADEIGRPWSTFNVEQQAALVESWFVEEEVRRRMTNFGPGIYGGSLSETDARFPYIRDVIRRGDRNAAYRPIALPKGGDPQIKRMQDKLVALGYLDARSADGLVGYNRSATLDAVRAFQTKNGLQPDRDFGGVNSETRRKLDLPIAQLRTADAGR